MIPRHLDFLSPFKSHDYVGLGMQLNLVLVHPYLTDQMEGMSFKRQMKFHFRDENE
ncbi:hypothetical protein CLV31_102160 [Algoriphagus aquaeductus]|jgi:hypothetical protein|uniref:Uncharacterized protein n=1 Tax=Algoriphagus aquaeductus TaxID=475299 RepID=A0A326RXR3_9BACT|nr:hypothetical protein CLV31_102160 [Algoriphagus aquaeductus]